MRLIDGDALIEKFNEKVDMAECLIDARTAERFATFCALADAVEEMPTVDAVEVVRCRECKYWGDEEGKLQRSDGALFARCKVHNYLLDGRHTGWCPTENDFCSYGERKDGDGNAHLTDLKQAEKLYGCSKAAFDDCFGEEPDNA